MAKGKQEEVKLSDLIADDANVNRGTQRGRGLLETSIRKHGFLEPGVLDKHNNIMGGNKRAEVAAELGMEDALIIDSDGTRPIYIRQTHLDLHTPEGRAAAVALNRVAQVSIDMDGSVLDELVQDGVDVSDYYFPEELEGLIAQGNAANAAAFAPNLEPGAGASETTQADIEKARKERDQKISGEYATRPVVCPYCAGEFALEKKEYDALTR